MMTLVFHGDLDLHCGGDLPASVLGDLQFKALWSRSSVMSQGDPSRRCKSGHLFTSWSDLVAADDSSGRSRNNPLASGLENRPLFYTHPRCKPCIIF